MRKLLFFLLLASPAFGAIAFSHQGSATTTSGTNVPSVTISSGETAVVCISLHGSAVRTISSVVDSSGANTYTQQITAANGNSPQIYMWTSPNVSNAATTVTVTASGTYTALNVIVLTYTGVNALGTSVAGTSASNTVPTVTLTTQDANNFVVACLGQTAGSAIVTFTANTGNLRLTQIAGDNVRIAGGFDNTAASATTVTNSVTSNKTAAWASAAVELRSGAGSPTYVPDGGFLVQ